MITLRKKLRRALGLWGNWWQREEAKGKNGWGVQWGIKGPSKSGDNCSVEREIKGDRKTACFASVLPLV